MSVWMDAVALLRQLGDAAKLKHGVYANQVQVPASGGERALAAQYLRERGIPIVATRARQNSMWYLLRESDPEQLKRQWRDRIVGDVYAELCRACQALSRMPSAKGEHDDLQAYAVQVGTWLGRSPTTVLTETRPWSVPNALQVVLDDVDQARR